MYKNAVNTLLTF